MTGKMQNEQFCSQQIHIFLSGFVPFLLHQKILVYLCLYPFFNARS